MVESACLLSKSLRDGARGFESLSLHHKKMTYFAPVAQLDRASDYGSEG